MASRAAVGMGIPMGIPVGMGWLWGLKCHPHGSPDWPTIRRRPGVSISPGLDSVPVHQDRQTDGQNSHS